MSELIEIDKSPVKEALRQLLKDKTTGKNIIFATDMYSDYGYTELNPMTETAILGFAACDIQPRVRKAQAEQNLRTRKKAEVFTPTWICNMMNNHCDSEWFGREDVFNHTDSENRWYSTSERITFPEGKTWQQYVDSRRLEITCGEAPYLVSRYDTTTGAIIPIKERIGMLDRKMRVINENAVDEAEWLIWTERAFNSVYGYEFQGDNLLIARINLLVSFCDYLRERWKREATKAEIKKFANIISWNLWQMDGLTDTIPVGIPKDSFEQMTLFGDNKKETTSVDCKIQDWRDKCPKIFKKIKDKNERGVNMKFDFVIGNPPYQEEISTSKENKSLSKQVFPDFIRIATELSSTAAELITPSRWFAGDAQDKSFLKLREFLKENNHISKIVHYQNEKEIFSNVVIKGGVSIFMYKPDYSGDVQFSTVTNGKEITVKRPLFEEGLDIVLSNETQISILMKIKEKSKRFLTEYTKGRNAFGIIGKESVIEEISSSKPFEKSCQLRIKGDVIRYITADKVTKSIDVFNAYKVFVSKSAGAPGKDLKIIGVSYVGAPQAACSDSLIPIGCFDNPIEAENLQKYMSTRFLRFMVSILKMSQNVTQIVYRYVPIQDFTENSDIDWSVSIAEIDKQLYKKYNLTQEEIDFIESHVKEMS